MRSLRKVPKYSASRINLNKFAFRLSLVLDAQEIFPAGDAFREHVVTSTARRILWYFSKWPITISLNVIGSKTALFCTNYPAKV